MRTTATPLWSVVRKKNRAKTITAKVHQHSLMISAFYPVRFLLLLARTSAVRPAVDAARRRRESPTKSPPGRRSPSPRRRPSDADRRAVATRSAAARTPGRTLVAGNGARVHTSGVVRKSGTRLHFTSQPQDLIIKKNQAPSAATTLSCSAATDDKYGPVTLSWQHNGRTIRRSSARYELVAAGLRVRRPGTYRCIATDKYGTIVSRTAKVEQAYLRLTDEISGILEKKVRIGDSIRLQCTISGYPAPKYSWELNRQPLPQDKRYTVLPSGVLQIQNVVESDGGTYRCRAVNMARGRHSSDIQLTIENNHNSPRSRPHFLVRPQNYTVNISNVVVLECLASGSPTPVITWTKLDGSTLDNMAGLKHLGGNLQVKALDHSYTRGYVCHARNQYGAINSTAFITTQSAPYMRKQLLDLSRILSITARFVCPADGVPQPNIRWLKDGLPVKLNGRIKAARKYHLVVSYSVPADSGYYQCIASNPAGEAIASAKLEIIVKPDAPRPPNWIVATPLNSTKIKITWSDVNQTGIIGFTLHWERTSGGNEAQKVVQDTSYTVTDLEPFTNYTFYIVTYHANHGGSHHSQYIRAATLPDVPLASPPTSVFSFKSGEVTVEWDPLPLAKARGIVDRYQIFYRHHGDNAQHHQNVVGTHWRSYTIKGLIPGDKYDIRVEPGTRVGFPKQLPESTNPWHTVTVLQADTISELQITANTTTANVSWTIIKDDRYTVTGYRLTITEVDGTPSMPPIDLPPDTDRYRIVGLRAGNLYEVSLESLTPNEDGQVAKKSFKTFPLNDDESPISENPAAPTNLVATARSESEILLRWRQPLTLQPVRSYTILYSCMTKTPGQKRSMNYIKMDNDDTEMVIAGLEPFTWYEFQVSAQTDTQRGLFSKKTKARTRQGRPGAPTNLDYRQIDSNEVELIWRPPKRQNGVITSYIVLYDVDKNKLEWKMTSRINGSVTKIRVPNLVINQRYFFKLRARTEAGEGPASPVIEVVTRCKGRCINTGHNSFNSTAVLPVDGGYGLDEQTMGIIIGSSIGVGCIIICIVIILMRNKYCLPILHREHDSQQMHPMFTQVSRYHGGGAGGAGAPGHASLELADGGSLTPMLTTLDRDHASIANGGPNVMRVRANGMVKAPPGGQGLTNECPQCQPMISDEEGSSSNGPVQVQDLTDSTYDMGLMNRGDSSVDSSTTNNTQEDDHNHQHQQQHHRANMTFSTQEDRVNRNDPDSPRLAIGNAGGGGGGGGADHEADSGMGSYSSESANGKSTGHLADAQIGDINGNPHGSSNVVVIAGNNGNNTSYRHSTSTCTPTAASTNSPRLPQRPLSTGSVVYSHLASGIHLDAEQCPV
ncbi:protogenin B-like [Tubulanus polymorphus]|uniref:protogenin B-like n=1 Tax=Tubulanus polymorphus TaxID=672921 RepID=UPI003DA6C5C2